MENEERIKQDSLSIYNECQNLQIATQEDYDKAAAKIITVRRFKVRIMDYFRPMKEAAHKAHKAVLEKEKAAIEPLINAENILKEAMQAYIRNINEERKRKQRELEQRAALDAAQQKEKLLQKAERLEATGKTLQADILRTEAETITPEPALMPQTNTTVTTENGKLITKKDVKVTVIEKMSLVQAVAAGHVPVAVLDINQQALKSWAKLAAFEDNTTIYGVHISYEDIVVVRGGKEHV